VCDEGSARLSRKMLEHSEGPAPWRGLSLPSRTRKRKLTPAGCFCAAGRVNEQKSKGGDRSCVGWGGPGSGRFRHIVPSRPRHPA
jgi:hypothetical protein